MLGAQACENTHCRNTSFQRTCTKELTPQRTHALLFSHVLRSHAHSIPFCLLSMGNSSNDISFTVERKLNHVVPDPNYDHEMSLL